MSEPLSYAVTVRLTRREKTRLDAVTARQKRSQSSLIRLAVCQLIDQAETGQPDAA